MSGLRLTLRERPPERLDLSGIVPTRLAGLEVSAIERLALAHGVRVGDVFAVRPGGDLLGMVIEGGSDRLDGIGAGMAEGSLLLDGDAGQFAGRGMTGGRLEIRGSVGRLAACGLRGGVMVVSGDSGDLLGAGAPGERAGMAGGMVVLRGSAGAGAGERMRRGVLVIEGNAGAGAGANMIAGTVVIGGTVGAHAGRMMRRGTLVLGRSGAHAGFVEVVGGLGVFGRLLGREVRGESPSAAGLVEGPLRRLVGDRAAGGVGEIVTP